MIVGYTLSDKADKAFVAETMEAPFHSSGKLEDLMFHNDSRIQYSSSEFFRLMKSKDITQSISRPRTPLDNAAVESFFYNFQKGELYHREYHTYVSFKKESITRFIF